MIIEQHYDDEVLIAFLHDEPSARRDPHLTTCRPCSETLQSLRHLGDALEAGAVWETGELSERPRQSTIDTLRDKQAAMAREDADAALRIKQLLAQPRETWAATIAAHPDWRTAGMVRGLVGEAEKTVTVMPGEAVEIARMAVELARDVPNEPAALVGALREYAYVLYFTGQYSNALQLTEEADEVIRDVAISEIDAARVRLLRALILADFGRDAEALALAEQSARVFEAAGDKARYVAAVRTQGIALSHLRRHRDAITIYQSVLATCSSIDLVAFGGLAQNIALCYREIGDFDNTTKFFLTALDTFQRLGSAVGITKTRWMLGRTFLAQGKNSEALSLLHEVRRDFEELTMVQDVALVAIDIAQALMALGKRDEVLQLCRSATEYFVSAGLTRTEGALTAMALIREASTADRLSEAVIVDARARVQSVPRKFVARAPE